MPSDELPRRSCLRSLALLAALCAGCATQPRPGEPSRYPEPSSSPTRPPPPVNLSGYSAAFKHGYSDGCMSARGTMRRDETRYRSDNDYMMGWSDGNSACRNRR